MKKINKRNPILHKNPSAIPNPVFSVRGGDRKI